MVDLLPQPALVEHHTELAKACHGLFEHFQWVSEIAFLLTHPVGGFCPNSSILKVYGDLQVVVLHGFSQVMLFLESLKQSIVTLVQEDGVRDCSSRCLDGGSLRTHTVQGRATLSSQTAPAFQCVALECDHSLSY